ncbi:unnamed protein product [Arctogadus glacialis]
MARWERLLNAVNLTTYCASPLTDVSLMVWGTMDVQDTALLFTKSPEACASFSQSGGGYVESWRSGRDIQASFCPPFWRRNVRPESRTGRQAETSTQSPTHSDRS